MVKTFSLVAPDQRMLPSTLSLCAGALLLRPMLPFATTYSDVPTVSEFELTLTDAVLTSVVAFRVAMFTVEGSLAVARVPVEILVALV